MDREKLLKGVIDIHVHAGPSVAARELDAADMLKEAEAAGYRGFLVKDHYFPSMMGCQMVQRHLGSGSVRKADISRYLDESGVDTFTRFSKVDLARLSDGILADNPRLSFVECRKKGNVLEIESVLSPESPEPLKTADELKAPGSGTVKDVKVYRGAALVKPGDTVREGDVLVTGTVTVKDVPVNVGVIARVTLVCQTQFVYLSEREGEEELAVMLAEESLELAGAEYSVISAREGDKVVYTVCVNYALVLFSG